MLAFKLRPVEDHGDIGELALTTFLLGSIPALALVSTMQSTSEALLIAYGVTFAWSWYWYGLRLDLRDDRERTYLRSLPDRELARLALAQVGHTLTPLTRERLLAVVHPDREPPNG